MGLVGEFLRVVSSIQVQGQEIIYCGRKLRRMQKKIKLQK
jgi:hypothetical protein